MQQFFSFFKLLFVLQKKNHIVGFLIGLLPILITSISIEFFIGKLISGDIDSTQPGLKALNVLLYFLIANSLTLSLTSLKKYNHILKNSYLSPSAIINSEVLMQYINFMCLLIVYALWFQFPLISLILVIAISLLLILSIIFLAYLIAPLAFIFDDFERIFGLIMQLLFWLSPVIYFTRDIKSNFAYLVTLNPFHLFYELDFLCFYPHLFDKELFYMSLFSFIIFFAVIYIVLKNLKSKLRLFL